MTIISVETPQKKRLIKYNNYILPLPPYYTYAAFFISFTAPSTLALPLFTLELIISI